MNIPKRLFLDTNVFINAESFPFSNADQILSLLGLHNGVKIVNSVVIISPELIDQIIRVGKRIWRNKDRASQLVGKIWSNLNYDYLLFNNNQIQKVLDFKKSNIIPSEDVEIYLAAKCGKADCFISDNRELIKAIADFECVTPEIFVRKYLSD